MGYRLMVFCTNPPEISQWVNSQCPALANHLHTFEVQGVRVKAPIVGNLPRTVQVLAEWRYASTAIQQAASTTGFAPDLVFFAWLDSYLSDYLTPHLVDAVFPYSWSGLYFHPYYLRSGQKRLPLLRIPLNPYALTKSQRCRSIALFDEMETDQQKYHINKPIVIFPDITDASPPDPDYVVAKQIREKAGDRKIVGLLGGLTKRKGLLTLIEVAKTAAQENWFFVFAGQLYEHELVLEAVSQIWKFVESEPENCFFYFDRIPHEAQFNAVLNECDVLFAAYENFPYSSNILTKAAIFEKLVIVNDGFCMSARVKQFQLGISISEGSVEDCINALRCLADPATASSPLMPEFEVYRQMHSLTRLSKALAEVCHT